MINFAELKLKLCEFDKQQEAIIFGVAFLNSKKPPQYTDVIEWKHTRDAKIIAQLLGIIEMQDKQICILHNYIQHNEDNLVGDDLKGDDRFTERFKRHIKSTNDCLSETDSKLKQLIKGV